MAKNVEHLEQALALLLKSQTMTLRYWSKLANSTDANICAEKVNVWLDQAAEQLVKGSKNA